MNWIEVKATFVDLPPDVSPILEAFRGAGIENTMESGNQVTGCLADVSGADQVARRLSGELRRLGADSVRTAPFVEQDWEAVWRSFFKPRRVGKRFIVQPTWEASIAGPDDIELLLDPGLAFGTGDHPTTRLCLELMDGLALDGRRVADIGCGSGILGIAAAKLGASVLATDIDPVAVEVARENAIRNKVDLELFAGDGLSEWSGDLATVPQDERVLDSPDLSLGVGRPGAERARTDSQPLIPDGRPFDVVLSNIISATLVRLAGPIASVLKQGGNWIVSGIVEENWPTVRSAAEAAGFGLAEELREDGWVAARFQRS